MESAEIEKIIEAAGARGDTDLFLRDRNITHLPKSIGSLTNLTHLFLSDNQLTRLPESIGNLSNLTRLYLHKNKLTRLPKSFGNLTNLIELTLGSKIRRTIVEQLGYKQLCDRLGAVEIDTWREYTLLKIEEAGEIYYLARDGEVLMLLKMICPSTNHIHIMRVPPDMTSAEAAITWINHGIHPNKFSVQT
jgi:leucine-rich repeat protein SHOC2